MTQAIPNRIPNNYNYRIAKKSGNVVCNNGGYYTCMGSRGAHVKVLARLNSQGQYVVEFGAHRDRVKKAAEVLGIRIMRKTKKRGLEIFA